MSIQYSIVVPVKDEASNIKPLIAEIYSVMQELAESWELIYVDDGSADGSLHILQKLCAQYPELRILSFDANYGQSSAFDAGFRSARGRLIVTLDGDGQNDPCDIPLLIKASADADLVCGQRLNRKDTLFKRIISRLGNIVRSKLCGDATPDSGCSLKLYHRSALDKIKLFDGMHRFLPALFIIEGFRIVSVPVQHRPRLRGNTKYSLLNRNFNTISDMLAVMWMRRRHLRYQFRHPQ